ncbi:hypothetical protein BCR42DRAFT_422745 [Absidia repens]|uniref:NDT80 domain-containing protein n=1 Tax=Absidia repens TaxID=90262 RepID=A0A1X2I5W3_9FUNG|nr:hypothetical protein BCR42DRAFT_422745 [Absidia repens]
MNKVQRELATNHQRAHSMPAGSFYNSGQLHQQKEDDFPVISSNKRRHPSNMTDSLFFGMTQIHLPIYQQNQSSLCQVELRCKVDRGFFLCDQHWTCYRRNYFQLTTAFTTHCDENQVFYIQNGQNPSGESTSGSDRSNNSLIPIEAFYIQLSAATSDVNQRVELIQLTAKRDKGPQQIPSMLPIQPGDGLLLQYPHDNSQRTVTYERLQFKSATANNGKKRATQQYFYLTTQLIAQDANHCQHVIASSQSSPLVVRGRSPGHYADTDQRLQHHTSQLTKPATKTKRKRNNSGGEKYNKGSHGSHQTTAEKEIHAPVPPSPSSLSPIPMSIAPNADSTSVSMPNSNSAPSFIQHETPHSHQYPCNSSVSTNSTSPALSSTPPPLPLQTAPTKEFLPSVSSSSISPLSTHPSSAIMTPTIPSDASTSSMFYMNGPPPAFNPHGRSFSANDSVWRLQQRQHYHYPPTQQQQHQHQQQQQQQQHQQVNDAWSGMHMMTPSWMERQRTESAATFGSYMTADESVISPRSSYARAEFSSPPSTTNTTRRLDTQSMTQTSLSSVGLPQPSISNKSSRIDDKHTDINNNDPAETTYILYPNTPWDTRQQDHLTDYNQGENKQ